MSLKIGTSIGTSIESQLAMICEQITHFTILLSLLKRREYISYAEWDNEESIRTYLKSKDHQEIKRHNTNIIGAKVVVKQYDVVR